MRLSSFLLFSWQEYVCNIQRSRNVYSLTRTIKIHKQNHKHKYNLSHTNREITKNDQKSNDSTCLNFDYFYFQLYFSYVWWRNRICYFSFYLHFWRQRFDKTQTHWKIESQNQMLQLHWCYWTIASQNGIHNSNVG